MKKTLLAVVSFLTWNISLAQAQEIPPAPNWTPTTSLKASTPENIDPAKRTDIRHLVELVAGPTMETQEKTAAISAANALPPGEYRTKLVELFIQRVHTKILDHLVSVYDKYYSIEEIKALLQFYETPVGQKSARVAPMILAEIQTGSGDWGMTAGRQAVFEVLAENPDLAAAMAKAQPATPLPPPPPPPPISSPVPGRIVQSGNVTAAGIVTQTRPIYPPLARQARIQGNVILHAIIDRNGKVEKLEVVSGHPLLIQAAMDAVRQWQYAPTLLNGEQVEVDTTITVTFTISDSPPSPPPVNQQ